MPTTTARRITKPQSQEQKDKQKITKNKVKEIVIEQQNELEEVKNEIFERTKAQLPNILKEKTDSIVKEIETIYQEKEDAKVWEETKYGQKLDTIDYGLVEARIAPLIMNRSVNFYSNITYTADELYIIYQEFIRMISEINKKLKYLPSKKKFCSFAGISTSTYGSYLQDFDANKRNVMQMIDDYITDVNLSSAQQGDVREITTMFRSKAEHGMIEASAPVVVEYKKSLNIDEIKDKLATLGRFYDADFVEVDKKQED